MKKFDNTTDGLREELTFVKERIRDTKNQIEALTDGGNSYYGEVEIVFHYGKGLNRKTERGKTRLSWQTNKRPIRRSKPFLKSQKVIDGVPHLDRDWETRFPLPRNKNFLRL